MPLTATCHCGAVRITLPAESAGVLACHCGDCQKMHGNFNAFLAAPIADITLDGGDALTWYQSSENARRAFCRTCGARVLKEVTPAGRWLISAGSDRRADRQAHHQEPLGAVEARLVRPPRHSRLTAPARTLTPRRLT